MEELQCDPRIVNSDGDNALHLGARKIKGRDAVAFLDLVIQRGVKLECENSGRWTALLLAAGYNNIEMTRAIVQVNPSLVNSTMSEEDPVLPIHLAALAGNTEMVRFLLAESGTSKATLTADGHYNLLYIAAKSGNVKCVESLSHLGVNKRGSDGKTSLFGACEQKHLAVVAYLLLKGSKVNVQDSSGETPLLWAIAPGSSALVNFLLDHGADPQLGRTKAGYTSIHLAAKFGLRDVIDRVLSLKGTNKLLSQQTKNGHTPLATAILAGNVVIAKALLNASPSQVRTVDRFGVSCLHHALTLPHSEIFDLLVEKFGFVSFPLYDFQNHGLLHHAAISGSRNVHRLYLERSHSPSIYDYQESDSLISPLSSAASHGQYLAVDQLLRSGVDVNNPSGDPTSQTSLDKARCYPQVFERILLSGGSQSDSSQKDERIARLQAAAYKLIYSILSPPKALSKAAKSRQTLHRADTSEALARVLLMMDTKNSLDDAFKVLIERFCMSSEWPGFSICSLCLQDVDGSKFHVCITCGDKAICESCATSFESKVALRAQADELERQIFPLRLIFCGGENFLHRYLPFSLRNTGDFQHQDLFTSLRRQIRILNHRCLALQTRFSGMGWDPELLPGYKFLQLWVEAETFIEKATPTLGDIAKEDKPTFAAKAEGYYKQTGNRETPRFNCQRHKFINVSHFPDLPDSKKSQYDGKGKLKNREMSAMLTRYSASTNPNHRAYDSEYVKSYSFTHQTITGNQLEAENSSVLTDGNIEVNLYEKRLSNYYQTLELIREYLTSSMKIAIESNPAIIRWLAPGDEEIDPGEADDKITETMTTIITIELIWQTTQYFLRGFVSHNLTDEIFSESRAVGKSHTEDLSLSDPFLDTVPPNIRQSLVRFAKLAANQVNKPVFSETSLWKSRITNTAINLAPGRAYDVSNPILVRLVRKAANIST